MLLLVSLPGYSTHTGTMREDSERVVEALKRVEQGVHLPPSPPCQRPQVCKAFLKFCDNREETQKYVRMIAEDFRKALSVKRCYPVSNLFGVELAKYLAKNSEKLTDWKQSFLNKVKEANQWRQNKLAEKTGVKEMIAEHPERFGDFGNLDLKFANAYSDEDLDHRKVYGELLAFEEKIGQYFPSNDLEFDKIIGRYTKMKDLDVLSHQLGAEGFERGPLNEYLNLISEEFKPDGEKFVEPRLPGLFKPKEHGGLQSMVSFYGKLAGLNGIVARLGGSCIHVQEGLAPGEVLIPYLETQKGLLEDLNSFSKVVPACKLRSNINTISKSVVATKTLLEKCSVPNQ